MNKFVWQKGIENKTLKNNLGLLKRNQEVNWEEILAISTLELQQSKDLYVLNISSAALCAIEGFAGLEKAN